MFTGPLPDVANFPDLLIFLAYNNDFSSALPPSLFSLPKLEAAILSGNPKLTGTLPAVLDAPSLTSLVIEGSGSLAADMESWPVFASSDTSSTTSTILFGNIWSCPIEPAIRDHSGDEAHAYACGDSEFVTPILVAAAAFALFAAAAAFTKHKNVYRLVCYYSRSKTVVLTDARKLVNVGYSCYKLVAAVLLASFGLSATYWNAHSAFDTQPALLKLSATLKTASDGFILPLLAITTLTLLYYIRWGWGMRFEGRVESELTGSGKPRSWRGTVKLAWLVARVMGTATVFDFVYVFFVATNPRMSTSTRTLLNALLSQFKSSFLNERAAAKQALKLANPAKRFNYLVFTMSAIMLLNALVVPCVLVLLLDERCFKFYDFWLLGRLQTQAPHDAVVPYTYCRYIDPDTSEPICPDPTLPDDGYSTDYFSTTFEYPWSLSEQCGSAVIQSYSPVVLSELTLSLILQPAMWWLCTDHGHSHASKWAILSTGLFVSLGLPNTVSMFADEIDAGLGGWAILPIVIGVFSAFLLAGWLLRKLAPTVASPTPPWFYPPNVDYLLDLFDFNVDEDRLLGQKATYTWPLQDRFWEHVKGFASSALDFLGFARGNFASEYDGLIDDAFRDGPEEEEDDEEEAAPLYRNDRFGRYLPFAYANLVKTTALILTFGLAAPLTAWVGCLGLLARWLTMSYLAERWRRKEDEEGGLVTDAQGLPFRCVVLVVACVLAFFGTAAVLSGVGGEASAWTWVGLGAMAGVLGAQTWLIGRETARKAARSAARSSDLREPLLDADDLAAAADNE
ncbi:hypothetical protein TeGR_g8291 [Tetraparma gracilis]|nr:hypothetical protein TeGR_g8291 [Tetraparma gracilis]